MNGVHDLGGMQCFGRIEIERDEPVFHEEWEGRMFALNMATAHHRRWNLDMVRHSVERIPPEQYLSASYYERWLLGLERRLVEAGLVTPTELASGRAEGLAGLAPLRPSDVPEAVRTWKGEQFDAGIRPRFAVDDRVVTRMINPSGHTRLPRYARGRLGVIHRDHGVFGFPDTNAMTREPYPQHCYSVRFEARELWGDAASERDAVYLDLSDDHLDPA